MSGLWVNSDKSCILILKSWYYIIILDSLILILQLLFLWAGMYSRYLLKTSHFGWISDILFPFSHCNTVYAYILCMYCENVIVYQKSISKFFVQKIPRVHFNKHQFCIFIWQKQVTYSCIQYDIIIMILECHTL